LGGRNRFSVTSQHFATINSTIEEGVEDATTSTAAMVFVGEAPGDTVFGLVRLQSPLLIPELTGQSSRLHWLCLVAGPTQQMSLLHEIGRGVATLLADIVRYLTKIMLSNVSPIFW